jgi:hypothetical protein
MSSSINELSFDGGILRQVSLSQSSEVAKFEFLLRFVYDSTSDDGRMSCHFVCSGDIFDEISTANIARRFLELFLQLFSSTSSLGQNDLYQRPINKLTVILPEEVTEMQGVLFSRQANIINEGMTFTIYNV